MEGETLQSGGCDGAHEPFTSKEALEALKRLAPEGCLLCMFDTWDAEEGE